MSADLHIHSMDGDLKITEEHMRCFFRSTVGHRYFDPSKLNECIANPALRDYNCTHSDDIANSDNVWIGEVSWLKAALFEDSETFVPDSVMKIQELIGDGTNPPVLTEELRGQILEALNAENRTGYRTAADGTEEYDVSEWLDRRMGHRLFTVSW